MSRIFIDQKGRVVELVPELPPSQTRANACDGCVYAPLPTCRVEHPLENTLDDGKLCGRHQGIFVLVVEPDKT